MRAVVQRSAAARVDVGGRTIARIDGGLVVLLGLAPHDGDAEVAWIVDKLVHLRVFTDHAGKMNLSVLDVEGEVLVVSQFTLYGDARRGRRPSFAGAARGPDAEAVYNEVVAGLRAAGVSTVTGRFGATMDVTLTNEGPVTILLDSAKTF